MKPGDLVHIFNFSNAGFTCTLPKIGLIIGYNDDPRIANPVLVLVDGEISGYNVHQLSKAGLRNETR